jgi:hypothetical protein
VAIDGEIKDAYSEAAAPSKEDKATNKSLTFHESDALGFCIGVSAPLPALRGL